MWWGVAAALLANVLYSTGFVLEKRALADLPALSTGRPLRLVRLLVGSPRWLAGSFALAAGFVAQLAVYRTLPIAAAQGLFVGGLVLLLLLSSALLGERASGRERAGVLAVLAALAMIVASLRDADPVGERAPLGRFLVVCLPALAAGLWLYLGAERRARDPGRPPTTGVAYGVAMGLLYGVSSLAIKGISGRLGGAGPGATAVDLLRSPYPYLLVGIGAAGLVLSQTALQRCRASLIVPVCTTVSALFTAVPGSFAFGEALPHDRLRLTLRLLGGALAVLVLLLLPRHEDLGSPAPRGKSLPCPRSHHMEPDDPLLRILACPLDKGPLTLLLPEDALYNPRLHRRYPILDGIPQLLPSSGVRVSDDEHARLSHRIAP